MTLFLQEDSSKEKCLLIIKIIDCYLANELSTDEIHYILDVLILKDILLDGAFSQEIKGILKNLINFDFSFYSSEIKNVNDN